MSFESKPVLAFWETTRACDLSCIHCRASAITSALPGELSVNEGRGLIDQIVSFGSPPPTIIFTGGDPLMRRNDLFELMEYSSKHGVGFAVSPAITDHLTPNVLLEMKRAGASSISISLDGACPQTHDSIRGRTGTFDRTIDVLRRAHEIGLPVQVNTAIMRQNYQELPQLLHLIRGLGVRVWELFFLVKVGRGNAIEDLTSAENESVCNFLYDVSFYEMTVRCVEAPFIRRVAKERVKDNEYWSSDKIYHKLREQLLELEGREASTSKSTLRPRGTLDGDGIVFVSYDGKVHPGGLLPVTLGDVRTSDLKNIYRSDKLLQSIRRREFDGKCGTCSFKEICGGSRARAFAYFGDPLASDQACILANATSS